MNNLKEKKIRVFALHLENGDNIHQILLKSGRRSNKQIHTYPIYFKSFSQLNRIDWNFFKTMTYPAFVATK